MPVTEIQYELFKKTDQEILKENDAIIKEFVYELQNYFDNQYNECRNTAIITDTDREVQKKCLSSWKAKFIVNYNRVNAKIICIRGYYRNFMLIDRRTLNVYKCNNKCDRATRPSGNIQIDKVSDLISESGNLYYRCQRYYPNGNLRVPPF